jgi:hypothetical protein
MFKKSKNQQIQNQCDSHFDIRLMTLLIVLLLTGFLRLRPSEVINVLCFTDAKRLAALPTVTCASPVQSVPPSFLRVLAVLKQKVNANALVVEELRPFFDNERN